jgi:NAD(P)-dependent dehydrogenase (short-subunit alcohol dehydrogenase family)
VPVADEQAYFAVNFWGAVYGTKEAVKHLQNKGGVLINVGSEASDPQAGDRINLSPIGHSVNHTTALRAMTSLYHSALNLGVRFCVLKST